MIILLIGLVHKNVVNSEVVLYKLGNLAIYLFNNRFYIKF